MGYERDDRRPGGYQGERSGYGGERQRDDGRGTSYGTYGTYGGSGARDYRGDRFNDDGRRAYGNDPRSRDDDRGFLERAGDEVRSWFGDEEAEHRRRDDERRYEAENRYGTQDARSAGYDRSYAADRGYGGQDDGRGEFGRGYGEQGARGYGERNDRSHHDAGYRSWRDRQMDSFDRDYDEYRRENQSRFDQEFHAWRQGRQGQRDLLGRVQEHQDVVGADGQHVGKVDHVQGDQIKLAKNDPAAGGRHHLIPSSWIQAVDDVVTLNKTADQARQQWRDAERSGQGGGLFGRDDRSPDAAGGNTTFGSADRAR